MQWLIKAFLSYLCRHYLRSLQIMNNLMFWLQPFIAAFTGWFKKFEKIWKNNELFSFSETPGEFLRANFFWKVKIISVLLLTDILNGDVWSQFKSLTCCPMKKRDWLSWVLIFYYPKTIVLLFGAIETESMYMQYVQGI